MSESDQQSSCWWLESRSTARGSPWLQSTLTELKEKTKAMLQLIEEDAVSFAQRAEMYYRKRPELISMVEDFYRGYRSLAEQFDYVKSESRTRLVTTFGTPFTSAELVPDMIMSSSDQANDSYYAEENAESEVDDRGDQDEEEFLITVDTNDEASVDSEIDDPEDEDKIEFDYKMRDEEFPIRVDTNNDEVLKLMAELERLREENKIQQVSLNEKDEEKKEAIRHLSLAVEVLKEETERMRKFFATQSSKRQNLSQLGKLKVAFGMLFHGTPRCQRVVSL